LCGVAGKRKKNKTTKKNMKVAGKGKRNRTFCGGERETKGAEVGERINSKKSTRGKGERKK